MIKKVLWQSKALEVFTETYEYLEKHFSKKAAENFRKAVDKRISFLVEQPTAGRKSNEPSVRFANIDSYRHIFYKVENDALHILTIFDNRQDPKKRPY